VGYELAWDASFGFAAMSADQVGAGTVFEVKCLFAIDSITAGYRGRLGAKAIGRSRRRYNKAEQADPNCSRQKLGMTANARRDTLDKAFRRVRDLDLSLQEQLRTLDETLRRECPEFAAAVDRLVTRLRHYGAGEAAPKIGDSMPSFVLLDESAQKVSLEKLLDRGPVAVTFHRGHWCPYCRVNINALVEAHKALPAGAEIVGIMPDRQKFVADLKRQSQVPFPILIDSDNGYAMSLNLTIWVGAEIQKMMECRRLDCPTVQGNSAWILPIPATFVVGRDGLVRARFIDLDYRNQMMISDMLAAML
jgi:peroxiredoxin